MPTITRGVDSDQPVEGLLIVLIQGVAPSTGAIDRSPHLRAHSCQQEERGKDIVAPHLLGDLARQEQVHVPE